ncbi:MAG: hydrogenase formation protein HypD [Candidatus Omnitrophica bacterium]|nr:hydrogenase formation protein HypD [Candidatus Omnitrophota bacterium]
MKYIDEFRKANLIHRAAAAIREMTPGYGINIMEVCGTHTQNFFRFGLDKLLPGNLNFIAGPGCPVCVSSQEYIDKAIAYARQGNTIVVTFGDMLRVPGTTSTLEKERAGKGNVLVAYSALDALALARKKPEHKIVFLAVGFETTASTIALSIMEAKKEKLRNLLFFPSLKTIPSAMSYLLRDKRLNLSGFLCPGHVSAIIGTKPYEFAPEKYGVGCCVAGFEPLDILEGIYFLVRQIVNKKALVENQYSRVVTRTGNFKAQRVISAVFRESDDVWRGLGRIPGSGLKLKNDFLEFDAEKVMPLKIKHVGLSQKQKLCRCGQVIKGLITPDECPLFRKICSPENPYGPCMVSIEGTCNAYYKYH